MKYQIIQVLLSGETISLESYATLDGAREDIGQYSRIFNGPNTQGVVILKGKEYLQMSSGKVGCYGSLYRAAEKLAAMYDDCKSGEEEMTEYLKIKANGDTNNPEFRHLAHLVSLKRLLVANYEDVFKDISKIVAKIKHQLEA